MNSVKVEKSNNSPNFSFKGFDLVKLIKGQRKTIVSLIGAGLGYLTTNNEIIAMGSALLFELIVESAIYYVKKYT